MRISDWSSDVCSSDLGPNGDAIAGAVPPYDIPNLKVVHRFADIGATPGVWRSGTDSATAFFIECFIDELAAAAGLDPLSFRIRMLSSKPRHAAVLKTAASLGGYAPFASETRSEERRVGKESVRPCRSRWSPRH